ncbi:MAG: hypothetical protein WDW38_009311 [Sanguina aurantia]
MVGQNYLYAVSNWTQPSPVKLPRFASSHHARPGRSTSVPEHAGPPLPPCTRDTPAAQHPATKSSKWRPHANSPKPRPHTPPTRASASPAATPSPTVTAGMAATAATHSCNSSPTQSMSASSRILRHNRRPAAPALSPLQLRLRRPTARADPPIATALPPSSPVPTPVVQARASPLTPSRITPADAQRHGCSAATPHSGTALPTAQPNPTLPSSGLSPRHLLNSPSVTGTAALRRGLAKQERQAGVPACAAVESMPSDLRGREEVASPSPTRNWAGSRPFRTLSNEVRAISHRPPSETATESAVSWEEVGSDSTRSIRDTNGPSCESTSEGSPCGLVQAAASADAADPEVDAGCELQSKKGARREACTPPVSCLKCSSTSSMQGAHAGGCGFMVSPGHSGASAVGEAASKVACMTQASVLTPGSKQWDRTASDSGTVTYSEAGRMQCKVVEGLFQELQTGWESQMCSVQ